MVVHRIKFEQKSIARAFAKEVRMVPVRIFGFIIASETFSPFIVIVVDDRSGPRLFAFYSKMVIGLFYQLACACFCFMNSLGKCDRRRNAGTLHFTDGYLMVCVDIRQDIGRPLGDHPNTNQAECRQHYQSRFHSISVFLRIKNKPSRTVNITFSTELSRLIISLNAWIAFAFFPVIWASRTWPWNNTLSAMIRPPGLTLGKTSR